MRSDEKRKEEIEYFTEFLRSGEKSSERIKKKKRMKKKKSNEKKQRNRKIVMR